MRPFFCTLLVCLTQFLSPIALAQQLANPAMSEGETIPLGWTTEWVAEGKIQVSRDTTTFSSAPAALCVKSTAGAAKGHAAQMLDVSEATVFTLAGKLRAEGKATALLGIQSYDSAQNGIEFKVIGNALPGLGWRKVAGVVTLPPKTSRFAVVLMIEGDGAVWLDDVSLTPGEIPVPDAAKAPPPAPAKAPNAWTAAEGFFPEYPHAWRQMHEALAKQAKHSAAKVLFIGDSITQGWDKELWKKHWEPLQAANHGIGGDGTPQVLWRIAHGEFDGLKPQAIVLMLGINNTWPGFTPADTLRGLAAVVEKLRAKMPDARLLLCGILPALDKDDPLRSKLREINQGLAKLTADAKGTIEYLDFTTKFVLSDGALDPTLYHQDKIHLTSKGYAVLVAGIEPVLHRWLEIEKMER